MDTASSFGTGLGLAAGAGLNAYAVLIVYGAAARFFPEEYPGAIGRLLGSTPALTALAVLFLLEFVADKVPVLYHVWDVLHTVVRPIAGAVLAIGAVQPHGGTTLAVVAGGGGGLVALVSHLLKGATRLTSTAVTAGIANVALSLAEDVVAFLQAVVSLFLPVVALVVVAAIALLFLFAVPKAARSIDLFDRRRRPPRRSASPPA